MGNYKEQNADNVIVSPVFKTEEQERFFAKCARESMDANAFLDFRATSEVDSKKDKVIVCPVFKTKKQEELFAKCAEESMSITAVLEW